MSWTVDCFPAYSLHYSLHIQWMHNQTYESLHGQEKRRGSSFQNYSNKSLFNEFITNKLNAIEFMSSSIIMLMLMLYRELVRFLKATCRYQNISLMNKNNCCVVWSVSDRHINYVGIIMKIPANADLFKSVYFKRKTEKYILTSLQVTKG